MMDNMIGRTLGQYQLVAVAGRGVTATVYKAYQPSLKRHVALKVLLASHLAHEPDRVKRFRQEALAAQVRHPNLLAIYDVGQEGNLLYIAAEYVEGETLAQLVQRTGGLDAQRATLILEQIASALDAAHQRGLTVGAAAGAVKPDNILIGPNDQVKLTNAGIGKALADIGVPVSKTPEYMSPEQIQGRPIDKRSDLYSLGVILYQMLTGYVPFSGNTPQAILDAHVNRMPTPPSKLTAFVTHPVEAVVLRALAKNPAERFASAGEMAAALAQAAGSRAPAEPTLIAPARPAASRSNRSLLVFLLAGAALLVMVAMAIVAIVFIFSGLGSAARLRTAANLVASATPVTPRPTATLSPSSTPAMEALTALPRPASWTPVASPTVPLTAPPTATPTATPPQPTAAPALIPEGESATPPTSTATRPPSSPTLAPPTRLATLQPILPSSTPTVVNEPRGVTPYYPTNGAQFKSSTITFKWSGGALQAGETFVIEIIPTEANKAGCTSDYGQSGLQISPPLTDHEWTTDINATPPLNKAAPCSGRIEWRVHVRDAAGNVIQSTPRYYFIWNPL